MSFDILVSALLSVFFILFMMKIFYSRMTSHLKSISSQIRALEKGIATDAEVIKVHKSSRWSGDKSLYKLTFRFNTAKGEVIEALLIKALTFKEITEYKEGNQIAIKYIPDDPHEICLLKNI